MPPTTKAPVKEQKAFAFQIKEFDDASGTVKGYLATFDNVDLTGDRIRPGAFKRTLSNKYAYKNKHDMKYLFPLLWQHDDKQPIGGYTEAKEDNVGLFVELQLDLDVQKGKEAYSGLKKGYIFQQSIGYDALQTDYVTVENKTVRDLIEVRLWEGSVVTFPANELAVVTSVKSMETKSVCGDTSLPIGPRDESWDGSKAKDQIFAYAKKDDDSIDPAKAKKCFLQLDGDSSLKGSYGYPFCYIENGSPRISVGGVKACAGALSGSRGASTSGGDIAGMRKKVETMYSRINKAYPDDAELTVPWKDDGKASTAPKERKTLLEHYNEEMAEDLLGDWQDVYICALTGAIFDAFTIGDTPVSDISDALDAFKEIVMSKFVAQAMECNLSQYIADNDLGWNPAESTIHNGSDDGPYYGYMSNRRERSRKARKDGRAISAANMGNINDHVKGIKAMAKQAKADMQSHVDDIHDAIDNMAGAGKAFNLHSLKAGRSISATNANTMHDMADKAMDIMQDHTKALISAANDFANTMQGAEMPAYGDGEGEADDDQREGKSWDRRSKLEARVNEKSASAVSDDALALALSELRGLRKASN